MQIVHRRNPYLALLGRGPASYRGVNHTTEKYIMTAASDATDKDFEQMWQMLTGFFVTQIAGAVATYSIADHLAKGPATEQRFPKLQASIQLQLSACCALVLHLDSEPVMGGSGNKFRK
jgi:hypothetical protein